MTDKSDQIKAAQQIVDEFKPHPSPVVDVREGGTLEMFIIFEDGHEQGVTGLLAVNIKHGRLEE